MKQRYCPECGSECVIKMEKNWEEVMLYNEKPIVVWRCVMCDCEFEDPFKKHRRGGARCGNRDRSNRKS